MEAGDVVGAILTVAQAIKAAVDGAKANKKKCKLLLKRIERLTEVLKTNSLASRLKGVYECPKVLLDLRELVQDSKKFIDSYGNKSWFKQAFSWQDIKEKFEDLNQRITDVVGDLNLYITTSIEGGVKHLVEQKPSTAEVEEACCDDVASEITDEDKETSILIWVDGEPDHNKNIIKQLTNSLPKLAVVQLTSTAELRKVLLNNRTLITTSSPSRCRIITNRARKNPDGSWNERAAHEVVELRDEYDSKIPILIYTSKKENVDKLQKELGNEPPYLNVENPDDKPYTVSTRESNHVVNFAKMSTVLYVWPNLPQQDYAHMRIFSSQGVVCYFANSQEAAIQWLTTNSDLITKKYFRVITNRYMKDFVKWLRGAGYSCPVMIFTSQQNQASAQASFKEFYGVHVGVTNEVIKAFGTMQPLGDESPKPLVPPPSTNPVPKHSNFHNPTPSAPPMYNTPPQQSVYPSYAVPPPAYTAPPNVYPPQQNAWKQSVPPQFGKLVIYNITCRELAPKDSNGLSDPFVKIKVGGKTLEKTPTKKKTLNPEWTNYYNLDKISTQDKVTFEVWDEDRLGPAEFEGQCHLDVADVVHQMRVSNSDNATFTFTLLQRSGYPNEKVTGVITLKVGFIPLKP